MGIIRNVDVVLNPGNGTVDAEDIVWQVPVTPNCGQLCEEIIQEEIICNQSDAWNNNLCPNDFCYSAPVVPGDCLHFQFQFQNTRNAKTTISYLNFLQRPNPKIRYNWYHPTINPTDWTIRARMFNACTNQEYKQPTTNYNYADVFMRQAGIFLSQDRTASSKTLPINSWYRWTQNAQICIPSQLPANFPSQFYFTFEVKNFANASSTVYSQLYEIDTCSNTIYLEGAYSLKDCFGYDYSIPTDNLLLERNFSPFQQVLWSSALFPNISNQYRNAHRLRGTASYVGRMIEKDIPERQCLSIKTSIKEQYNVKLKPIPPYVAEIVNNNLSGKVAYLSGVPGKGAIEVQPNGGAEKANDISNMWVVDLTLNGCECLDYHQC
jgi:hypothetical protein